MSETKRLTLSPTQQQGIAKLREQVAQAKEIQKMAQSKGEFLTIADGQTRKLHFLPGLTQYDPEHEFENKTTGEITKSKRWFFYCADYNNESQETPYSWGAGVMVAEQMLNYFEKGFVDVEIKRSGIGLSTRYQIMPIL